MLELIVILLLIVIFGGAFGFMIYRDSKRRTKEKRRNQYNDRI